VAVTNKFAQKVEGENLKKERNQTTISDEVFSSHDRCAPKVFD